MINSVRKKKPAEAVRSKSWKERNTDRFIALPVGRGDAFFLETNKGSVLVDGGLNKKCLLDLFNTHIESKGVDILVCTHNDADHANGVLGFLKSSLTCNELWLPATWLQTLKALPNNPSEWRKKLIHLTHKISKEHADAEDPLEAYGSSIRKRTTKADSSAKEPDFEAKTLDAWLDDDLDHKMQNYEWFLEESNPLLPWPCGESKVFFSASQATSRILQIAEAALHRGIKIRCFQYGNPTKFIFPHPVIPLAPVNSVPVLTLQPTTMSPEILLALTTVNQESLSFWYKPNEAHPGVLFTADTDLAGIALPNKPLAGAIVTAPHHGSADNKSVYGKISQDVVWVRSDGFSKSRPCQEYLAKKIRYCTLCRNSNRAKQAVRLVSKASSWVREQPTQNCNCK